MKLITILAILTAATTASCGSDPFTLPEGTPTPYHPDVTGNPSSGPLREGVPDGVPIECLERFEADPEIKDGDSLKVQAIKIAVSRHYGNVTEYYTTKKPYKCGFHESLEDQLWYMNKYVLDSGEAGRQFRASFVQSKWTFWYTAYQEYKRLKSVQAETFGVVPPGYKVVHATGIHQCWSRAEIGYTCQVENRIYNDCNVAVMALQRENCCRYRQPDGSSNGFTSTGCF